METVVNAIHSYSSSCDYATLVKFMKDHNNVLLQQADQLLPSLDALDLVQHSLGYLLVLDVAGKVGNLAPERQFVEIVSRFLLNCDQTQMLQAPEIFCRVCRRLRDSLVRLELPHLGIYPLSAALRKLQPTTEHLTPVHVDVFQLCLLSKRYAAAVPLLEEDIYCVDPATSTTTATDVLLYCYYGGLLCTGRKRYSRALELFRSGLTAPSHSSNAITVAIYKKYVLVSLIHTGGCAPLPRYASSKSRGFEADHKPYAELVKAYATHSPDKLRAVMATHGDAFAQDGNLGLAQLVLESLVPRNVQRLTQTYLTLSLADIAASVGLPSAQAAEAVVLRMIEVGQVFAEVDPRVGMVRFLEDPQQFCSAASSQHVHEQLRSCIAIGERLQAFHDQVSTDKAFISKAAGARLAERSSRLEVMDELPILPGFPG